jgi:hypothetical protein
MKYFMEKILIMAQLRKSGNKGFVKFLENNFFHRTFLALNKYVIGLSTLHQKSGYYSLDKILINSFLNNGGITSTSKTSFFILSREESVNYKQSKGKLQQIFDHGLPVKWSMNRQGNIR